MDPIDQIELLNRHVPILRFDARELFYPTAIEPYIAASSLIVSGTELHGPGTVTVDHLSHHLGSDAYLRFVTDNDRRSVVKEEAKRLAGKLLGPRLGRVGYFGRFLDALFLASVVVRPTTPRLTTVAAAIKADRSGFHRQPSCYGRALEVGDWLVLHYAFFYVMNDWRSGYRGVNDHEADWEQAWIFCDPADQRPVWIVASSHDHVGANLRRHWDDTECTQVNDQPVLFVGAGSHALFFRPGDYVSRIDVPALRWLLRIRRWGRWALRIGEDDEERGLGPALGVPFVDSATGDGITIGQWDLEPLDEQRSCFGGFSGLWGLDTGDPLDGERGPAGPKFSRDGEIRRSWADPVGFAGLHGTTPPSLVDPQISLDNIEASLAHLEAEIRKRARLSALSARVASGEEHSFESDRLTHLLRQRTELQDLRRRLLRGDIGGRGIRDHLTDPAVPLAPPKETGLILAIWATVSVPLVMLSVAAPFLLSEIRVLGPLLGLAALFSVLEQLVRRRFTAAIRLAAFFVALALFFGFVGVITVSVYAFGASLAAAAILLFIGNLGELTAYRRRRHPVDVIPPASADRGS
ncbi:MAG: hypothetical protein GY724_10565 [Actinomycetia bacterium]|nr:hypothetical protein [Actinomycetes bacterium]MCP5030162.1 hypothetical protein [Actinomycetes bacterium]